MSDTGQLPNTVWALVILWGLALPAFWHGMDLVMKPPRRWPEALFSFSLGLGIAYGGLAVIGFVAPELGRPIAKWIQPIASDPRWAILVWFIALSWLTGPRLIERIRGASANALRLADEDAAIMEQRIQYLDLGILGEPQGLAGTAPFIEFHLDLINAPVFPIEWEPQIDGRIFIDGDMQKDPLETRPGQSLGIARSSRTGIVMKLWLTPMVVGKMRDQVETSFDFRGIVPQCSFDYLGEKRLVRKPIAMRNQVVIWKNMDRWVAELERDAKVRNS